MTQWIVSMTVLAILLTNFLSSVVILNPSAYQGQGNWLTGEKVLICTSEGLRWIRVETLRQQNHHETGAQNTTEHHGMKFHCPFLKHHQPLGIFPAAALFFLLALISLIAKTRLAPRPALTERIYFSYAPKHSPPLLRG